MKRGYVLALAAVPVLAFASITADILKKLNIAEKEAQEAIFGNFTQAGLYHPNTSAIRNFALGKREEAVRELGNYIRSYTQTPDFNDRYQQIRSANKPAGPEEVSELLKTRLEELDANIKQTEEDMKKASGDMKKLYEFTLKTMKEEYKALKDPQDPKHQMYMAQLGDMSSFDPENYKRDLADFDKRFPPTVNELVTVRLKDFLALTSDINFNAALVERNGRKIFADPKLEAKDGLWKKCFRAGPETIGAARKFAQEWLAQLQAKKPM